MGQWTPVLRHRVWIAPIEPALTYATPDEVIGFEDAAYASLGIVHYQAPERTVRGGWLAVGSRERRRGCPSSHASVFARSSSARAR
jgi:hypothetical protein